MIQLLSTAQIDEKARALFAQERTRKVLNGWFLSREIAFEADKTAPADPENRAAAELEAIVAQLPLDLSEHAIFAGTQRDAFAASYALINPAFQVETFRGYCDPLEVYDYATPHGDVTRERIDGFREQMKSSPYVRALSEVYGQYGEYTDEVAFFMEQVTGHVIPDFRPILKYGINEYTIAVTVL